MLNNKIRVFWKEYKEEGGKPGQQEKETKDKEEERKEEEKEENIQSEVIRVIIYRSQEIQFLVKVNNKFKLFEMCSDLLRFFNFWQAVLRTMHEFLSII